MTQRHRKKLKSIQADVNPQWKRSKPSANIYTATVKRTKFEQENHLETQNIFIKEMKTLLTIDLEYEYNKR